MEQKWIEILGQMQPVKPGSVDAYANDVMGIFIPKEPMDFTEIAHIHRGYEFVISFNASSPYKVENKLLVTEPKKIFPFNPEQSHQAIKDTGHELIAIFLDAEFLQGLAKSIHGVQKVSFMNSSHPYDAHLKNLLLTFIDESKQRQGGYNFIAQSIAVQTGICLLRGVKSNCSDPKENRHYSHKRGINQAIEFIHENYHRNFSLSEVAQVAYLSPYHFSRVFKAEIGRSPFEYLLDLKIEKAKEYLRYGDKSVTEICFESGFNNTSHFTRVFLRKVGITPTAFRKNFM